MSNNHINIGFGNIVMTSRMIAVLNPDSAPVKRIIQEAKVSGNLVDATYGRKCRVVILMDTGMIILSAIQPETVASRLEHKKASEEL